MFLCMCNIVCYLSHIPHEYVYYFPSSNMKANPSKLYLDYSVLFSVYPSVGTKGSSICFLTQSYEN